MKQIIKKFLPKNRFARSVSILAGGTAAGQAVSVLSAPLLTRLYSPTDFGLLAVFVALLELFTVVAAGRYELTIVLPESDQDAASIVMLSLLSVILTTVFSLAAFMIWSSELANALNAPALSAYLWLMPLGVFFVGTYNVFARWAFRTKNFLHVARTRIFQSLGTAALQISGYKLGPLALLGGQALGQGIGATSLMFAAMKRPELRKWSWRGIWNQAIRYRKFPIYSTWTALLNTASLQLAPIFFIALYGSAVAGLYALTLRILSLPSNLIGNAIGNVFIASAPDSHRRGQLATLVESLHSKLAMFGIPPLMVLFFFGPDLFAFVFGEEWRKAGLYARWMAPWIYLQFQWSPLSNLATVLELQKAGLISQMLTFVSRFGVLLVGYTMSLAADHAVLAFAIVSAVVYLGCMLWFISKAGVKIRAVIFTDVKYLSIGFLVFFPIWVIVKVM